VGGFRGGIAYTELVRIIESVLLLNTYALIPGPEPRTVKVINRTPEKIPEARVFLST
jgi:hypothetical protein